MMMGENDAGDAKILRVDSNSHIETAVHSPRLPFGAIHAERMVPIFQHDAVYGIDQKYNQTTTYFSGTATNGDSAFVVTTGTTIYGAGVINSRKRLRYRLLFNLVKH